MSKNAEWPVVVVGAGPVGLAAAAHLLERGLTPLVLEAGPTAGASVRQWHHVRLFSRWAELVDPAAAKLLAPTGWRPPDPDTYPTGREWATAVPAAVGGGAGGAGAVRRAGRAGWPAAAGTGWSTPDATASRWSCTWDDARPGRSGSRRAR